MLACCNMMQKGHRNIPIEKHNVLDVCRVVVRSQQTHGEKFHLPRLELIKNKNKNPLLNGKARSVSNLGKQLKNNAYLW